MANKSVHLDLSTLDVEYEMLKGEIEILQNLYIEAKNRLDQSTGVKSNPVFVVQQTANLISIRDKLMNLYDKMAGIKKSKMDYMLKEHNANSKITEETSGNSAALKELFNMLMNQNRSDMIKSSNVNDVNLELPSGQTEEDIDELINQRLNENRKKEKEVKEDIKEKEIFDSYLRIVVDKDRNLYVIDPDYNLIEDLTEEHRKFIDKIVITHFINEDDPENMKAVDSENNEYEVIEFEEE